MSIIKINVIQINVINFIASKILWMCEKFCPTLFVFGTCTDENLDDDVDTTAKMIQMTKLICLGKKLENERIFPLKITTAKIMANVVKQNLPIIKKMISHLFNFSFSAFLKKTKCFLFQYSIRT